MKCPDHALCHVFEPITQVIVEVPCLLDLLVIALPVLFEKLVEGKEMMGIKTSGVKEPNRKSPRDTPVTVSEGVNRDEAVMGDSACYYGMQGFRPLEFIHSRSSSVSGLALSGGGGVYTVIPRWFTIRLGLVL